MSEEAAQDKPSTLEQKIIRQVEFYFSDRNLRRDKFLLEQVKKDDGWVALAILLTFNRLKQLTTDAKAVAAALRKSEVLEVNEDGSKVRRPPSKPLPDPTQKRSAEQQLQEQQRTVYAKGFPLDTTLDELEEYFDQFGPYDIITMRKKKEVGSDGEVTVTFKGSVFVEFKEESNAAKFIDPKELKYKDILLLREYKNDYIKRKKQEEADRKRELLEEEEKRKKEAQPKVEFTHGHIMKFVGCGQDTNREKIKAFFAKYATVLWVEFNRGDTEGYIRFQEEDGAKRAVVGATEDAEDGKVMINGGESSLSIAEGEDEQNFYKRVKEAQSTRFKRMKGGGKGKPKKRQREMTKDRAQKPHSSDGNSSPVKQEEGDDDEADDQDVNDESPPSPKRAKQESSDDVDKSNEQQTTKQDDDVATSSMQQDEQ